MTAAFLAASPLRLESSDAYKKSGPSVVLAGAQSLLVEHGRNTAYVTSAIAVALYVAVLVAGVTWGTIPRAVPQEEPLELVMLPPEAPPAPPTIDPPMPEAFAPPPEPVPDTPPTPDTPPPDITPPPPEAAEPIAPVKPPPPPPVLAKPVVAKPPPPKPVVRKKTAPAHPHPAQAATRAAPGGESQPASNALASGYANQVHSRIARIAASNYPESAMMRHATGRVGYKIVIAPSGALLSKSISPSGDAALDSAAAAALERGAPYPATGMAKPVSLTGAVAYRLN